MPTSLFIMADIFRKSLKLPTIYFGNCIRFGEKDRAIFSSGTNVERDSLIYSLKHCDYIIQPSTFWNRSAWLEIGPLDVGLQYAFDWEWFLRAQKMGIFFTSFPELLSLYRIHDKHKSGNGGINRDFEIVEIYKKYTGENAASLYMKLKELSNNPPKENIFYKLKNKLSNIFGFNQKELSCIERIYPKLLSCHDKFLLDGVIQMTK